MKDILIIDERVPYTGGTRTEKIIKYLPKFGWRPIILTIDQMRKNPFAFEILEQYKDSPRKIYGTKTLPNFYLLNKLGLQRLGSILNRLFFVPDTNVNWIPNAIAKASTIFKNESPQIIYSTSPNEGVHIIGYLLKLIFNKPWVADFRDLWTLCHGRYAPLTYFHHALNYFLEKSIYQKWSDLIIANTEENKRIIVDHFRVDPEKIKVVTNGFDPDEIILSSPDKSKRENLVLGYFGAFIKPMTCHQEFLSGFEEALGSQKRFILKLWAVLSQKQKQELLKNPIVRNHISFREYTSHKQGMKELAEADVLVIILKKTFPYVAPQKLYNYLALNKPILAIVPPEGCTARIIRETNSGIVVSPENHTEIAKQLLDLHKKWERAALKSQQNITALNKYRSDNLTKDLALTFSALI